MQIIFSWKQKNPKSVRIFTITKDFAEFPTAKDLEVYVTGEEKNRCHTKLHKIIFPSGEKLRREQVLKAS